MPADLASRLGRGEVLHLPSDVTHARRGEIRHGFRYRVDYLLVAPEHAGEARLFGRNRFNLYALHDRDHGGRRGAGEGAAWAWRVFEDAGVQRRPDMVLALMTQPRFLGFWFNPVSFWMLLRGRALLAVIAEVNNTFGQRHCYLCHNPGFAPIGWQDRLDAAKVFHVSPFQDVAGHYEFRFRLTADTVAVYIRQADGLEGLVATLRAPVQPMTVPGLVGAALRRPGGALRVLGLIYWQALRLRLRGAAYRPVPAPPTEEISR